MDSPVISAWEGGGAAVTTGDAGFPAALAHTQSIFGGQSYAKATAHVA